MFGRWAKWLGASAVAEVTTWLAWLQVADRLPHWSLYAVLGGVALCALLAIPLGANEDGSTRRLLNAVARGDNNAAIGAGDGTTLSGVFQHTGKGDIIAVTVTAADAAQISNDTGRNELSRDTKAITMPNARAPVEETLNERFGELTDTLIEHINARDTKLFARFADPRFLGPLGVAHRSYAEIGSQELRTTLSRLLTDLAAQPAGTRREVFLRQAIDVTRNLTIEHVNSLAVKLILQVTLTEPYDTDMLIEVLDTLLSPYYERIATSSWDYQYMSSTGVCQDGQLGAFATDPSQFLYEKYRNSMYPALRTADVRGKFIDPDGPFHADFGNLLEMFAEDEDDVRTNDEIARISVDAARFRLAPTCAARVLSSVRGVESQLTDAENELRTIVLARSLSLDAFNDRISTLKPGLANLFETLRRTGALHFPMQPVGFVLAQHKIHSRAPQLAGLVDEIFDDQP